MSVNLKRYVIHYARLQGERVPVPLRSAQMLAWVKYLCAPVVRLFDKLMVFRTFMLYRLSVTPQVVYLRKMLNDKYDPVQRRIAIEDGIQHEPVYLYLKSEDRPILLKTKAEGSRLYLFKKGETVGYAPDFIVRLPSGLRVNRNEMKALIDAYKLAGKKFEIDN